MNLTFVWSTFLSYANWGLYLHSTVANRRAGLAVVPDHVLSRVMIELSPIAAVVPELQVVLPLVRVQLGPLLNEPGKVVGELAYCTVKVIVCPKTVEGDDLEIL